MRHKNSKNKYCFKIKINFYSKLKHEIFNHQTENVHLLPEQVQVGGWGGLEVVGWGGLEVGGWGGLEGVGWGGLEVVG